MSTFNKPKVKAPTSNEFLQVQEMMRNKSLHTVCEEAACPNISECWKNRHAAFMIMGALCTRRCHFCNVTTGKPKSLNPNEPKNIADSVQKLNLQHVVITSVTRDDLLDGGAAHYVKVMQEIRKNSPQTTIEILTPDFLRKDEDLTVKFILNTCPPDVYNHNIETSSSLFKKVRPGGSYEQSLHLLRRVKELNSQIFTKSGMMVGLNETDDEVLQVMDDLRSSNVDFITIGQYLQPTQKHSEVMRYVTPEMFKYYEEMAWTKGFLMVSSSPLTRSSYHADEDFKKLKKKLIIDNLAI